MSENTTAATETPIVGEMHTIGYVVRGYVYYCEVLKPTRELWDALLGAGLR